MTVRLQPLARAKVATLGESGRAWHESLPRLLDEVADRWGLTLGKGLPGGSASYVIGALTRDGEPRVVKLVMPDPALADEAGALTRAAGRGHVLLHDHDAARGALLLESLGSSLDRRGLAPEEQLEILGETLTGAWGLPRAGDEVLVDKAVSLAGDVERRYVRLGAPCSRRVLDLALLYAERRAGRPLDRCVLVHGDPHPGNALHVWPPRKGAESGYVFVDPDGFLADPAYDLGVALRDWSAALHAAERPRNLLEGYAARLARMTGLDEAAIWEWGFLERVSTGLYVLDFGAERIGRSFLDSAELLI